MVHVPHTKLLQAQLAAVKLHPCLRKHQCC